MIIKINLSDSLKTELSKGHMKTVNAISHILDVNISIKTDIQNVNKTALKDLYIIDGNRKYYCNHAQVDSIQNCFELSF